jgi:hypothetical protein
MLTSGRCRTSWGDRRVQRRGEGEAKNPAGLGRINDAVIPQPRSRIVRVPLRLVLRADRRLEFFFFLRAPFAALEGHAVTPDCRQHAGGLLSSHDADTRIGPHPEKARRIGPATHAVIAGPEAAADQHGDLRDLSGRNRGHHLGAVLCDPSVLVLPPDHEARDVLQEQEGHAALRAQFDEVRTLLRRLREQDAIVGDDSDRHAVEAREPGNQRRAVARLELVEARTVDKAGDDLAHVVGLAGILRDDAVEFGRIVERLLARLHGDPHLRHAVEISDDPARQVDGVASFSASWSATPETRV